MRRDRPPDHEVIRSGLKCVARSHGALLVARLRPARPNPGHDKHELAAKLCAKHFDFVRACHNTANSIFDPESGQTQNLIVDLVGNAKLLERVVVQCSLTR